MEHVLAGMMQAGIRTVETRSDLESTDKMDMVVICAGCNTGALIPDERQLTGKTSLMAWHDDHGDDSCNYFLRLYSDKKIDAPKRGTLDEGVERLRQIVV